MAESQRTGTIKTLWRAGLSLSFLFVLIFALLFLYFNTSLYGGSGDLWKGILTGEILLVFGSLIVGLVMARKVVFQLAKVPYWKQITLKFIPSFFLTAIILYGLSKILNPLSVYPLSQIAYVPLPILLFHIFVVSQVEEICFRGIIYESILKTSKSRKGATWISTITFSLFHFMKTGGSWLLMATYIPLSLCWVYLKNNGYPWLNRRFPSLFGATPYTQQSNAGSHAGWNVFIVGFLKNSAGV